MSRHWSEHSYLDAENLWSFIDEQSIELDNLTQCDSVALQATYPGPQRDAQCFQRIPSQQSGKVRLHSNACP
jgi:hypothetical protein